MRQIDFKESELRELLSILSEYKEENEFKPFENVNDILNKVEDALFNYKFEDKIHVTLDGISTKRTVITRDELKELFDCGSSTKHNLFISDLINAIDHKIDSIHKF